MVGEIRVRELKVSAIAVEKVASVCAVLVMEAGMPGGRMAAEGAVDEPKSHRAMRDKGRASAVEGQAFEGNVLAVDDRQGGSRSAANDEVLDADVLRLGNLQDVLVPGDDEGKLARIGLASVGAGAKPFETSVAQADVNAPRRRFAANTGTAVDANGIVATIVEPGAGVFIFRAEVAERKAAMQRYHRITEVAEAAALGIRPRRAIFTFATSGKGFPRLCGILEELTIAAVEDRQLARIRADGDRHLRRAGDGKGRGLIVGAAAEVKRVPRFESRKGVLQRLPGGSLRPVSGIVPLDRIDEIRRALAHGPARCDRQRMHRRMGRDFRNRDVSGSGQGDSPGDQRGSMHQESP